ncbi:MAG: DUF4124 domain-containing protein [Hyphomicrobiales bacterium]
MKPHAIIGGLIGLMVLLPAAASADIYRWKDASGVMHFSNQPPPEGTVVIEKIEEEPYDAQADRQRIEEERRLRLERQKLEVEERKAEISVREREAQLQMQEANRRMQEAQQLEQQARQGATGDCDDDYYVGYGSCGGYYGGRYSYGRPGSPDLYRNYYRFNNSLYYKDHRRPDQLPVKPPLKPPDKPGQRPTPRPEVPKSAAGPGKAPSTAQQALTTDSAQLPRK